MKEGPFVGGVGLGDWAASSPKTNSKKKKIKGKREGTNNKVNKHCVLKRAARRWG